MNYPVLVLRLIHIMSGVFWVGGSIVLALFISPAVAATGEAGQKVLAHIVTRGKISVMISIAAGLTVLAGGWLYWIDSGGLTSGWTYSPAGWGFATGAIFAIVGFVFGILVGKNVNLLGNLVGKIQGKPTPEQLGLIQAAQKQLAYASPISTVALILALACMATARYW